MNKEAMLSLHTGGSFIVTFNDEKDYEIFKKERSKYIGMIIAILITFILLILSFILMLNSDKFIIAFIVILLIMVLEAKIFNIIEKRFNNYKYDLIIKEIKKNKKYRLVDNDNGTGRIIYSKDGIKSKIYVFKGKNAKSAR